MAAAAGSCCPAACLSADCGLQMESDHVKCLERILQLQHRGMSLAEIEQLCKTLSKVRVPMAAAFSARPLALCDMPMKACWPVCVIMQ